MGEKVHEVLGELQGWDALKHHKFLSRVGLGLVACGVFLVPFWIFDSVEILGVSRWEKPMKFFVSTGIFCLTYSWLSAHISRWPRLVYWTGVIIAISFIIEMIGIAGAAAFETTSHFNVSNPLSATVWAMMATFVNVIFASTIALSILIVFERQKSLIVRVGLGLGSSITAVGMGIAFFMTGPTEEQASNFQGIVGAHAVGVADGGPGLPLLGWSTIAGDLRVGHFFGLHAIQLAIALLITQSYLPRFLRLPLVVVGSLAYLGFILVVTGQALRAEPFTSPSTETLTQLLILLVVSSIVFVVWVVVNKQRQKVRN